MEERREMILDAAIPLFSEHGHAVTTKQIADAAGIAEGTVFRAFKDKRELCEAAVARYMDPEAIRTGLTSIDPSLTLEQKVRAVVVLMRARFAGITGIMSALGISERHGRRHIRRGAPIHHHAQMEGLLSGLLESERDRLRIDPTTSAQLIRLIVFASEIPAFNDPKALTTDELVDFILRGIAREDG